MAATLRNLRSMLRSKRFKQTHGLTANPNYRLKKPKDPKLLEKLLLWEWPDDDKPLQK
jgi:hypothetical protein